MPGPVVRCANPRCTKYFEFLKGKRYCRKVCAELGRRAKKANVDFEKFQKATLVSPLDTEEAAGLQGNEWMVMGPMIGILKNAPTRAIGYRMGAPKGKGLGHGNMRWFPTYRTFPRGVFPVKPFQNPLVPHQGEYLVAYFDEAYQLIGEPDRRVEVHVAWSTEAWYLGDLNLEIRPECQRA